MPPVSRRLLVFPTAIGAAQLASVLLLWLHVGICWQYNSVEAATELCYARSLLEGGGLALQPGATLAHGFDSLLWVGLLLVAQAAGLPALLSAKLLGAFVAALAVVLLPGAAARLSGRRRVAWIDLVAPLLLALNPTVAREVAGGLGCSAVLLLLVLALRVFFDEEWHFQHRSRRLLVASSLPLALLPFATASLVAPAILASLILARLLSRVTARRWRAWGDSAWLTVILSCCSLYLMGSYLLFADPWPGAVTAREALPETRLGSPLALTNGWWTMQEQLRHWGWTTPLWGLGLLGAMRAGNYWARFGVLTMATAVLLSSVVTGGHPTGRQMLPALLGMALLSGAGLELVLGPIRRLLSSRWLQIAGLCALCVGLAASPLSAAVRAMDINRLSIGGETELAVTLRQRLARLGLAPRQVTVMTDVPGAMAWHRFRVVDTSGVTDPAIRRYNGNRKPLELGDLVLRERRPDLLIERFPWKHVHGLTYYPEVRRSHVPISLGRPGIRASISKRLLLDDVPFPDQWTNLDLGEGLRLLGARVVHGGVVLLWSSKRNAPNQRRLRLGVGSWSQNLQVGARIYPMPSWRAGEIVRQLVRLPHVTARQLWLDWGEGQKVLHGLDPKLSKLGQKEIYRRRLAPLIKHNQWDHAEMLLWIWRDPRASAPEVLARRIKRIRQLMSHGQLTQAARQIVEARDSHGDSPTLKKAARDLARQAYQKGQSHARWARWPLAFATLEAAARLDPPSAWIRHRLEQARTRLPGARRLVKLMELEVARRALTLNPTPESLVRLMRAQLALDRNQEAMATWLLWGGRVSVDDHGRFMVARAAARTGRTHRALELLERLLARVTPKPQRRRCPPWYPLEPRVLQAQLRDLLGLPRREHPPALLAPQPPASLGDNASLLASCVKWSAGRPTEVTLHIWHPSKRELALELRYGSRRRPLALSASNVPLRRVAVSLHLPPATYSFKLRRSDRSSLDLGSVSVGPESGFGFELPGYVPWRREGEAFGSTPVSGRSAPWRFLGGYEGERYADSFVRGFDRAQGKLVSPPFRIRKSYLMLLVAGGRDPDLGVDLWVDQRRVFTVNGQMREVLRPVFVPTGQYRGRWAQIVIRDHSHQPWGHLAVDEIRQLEGPAPGVAP